MTKFGGDNLNRTTNRGVEAKEVEIANITLDRHSNSCSSSLPASRPVCGDSASSAGGGGDGGSHPLPVSSSSYVQVVVQQQRVSAPAPAAAAARHSPRLPRASSPLRHFYVINAAMNTTGDVEGCGGGCGGCGGCGEGVGARARARARAGAESVLLLPASLVLPARPARGRDSHAAREYLAGGDSPRRAVPDAGGAAGDARQYDKEAHHMTEKPATWRMLSNISNTNLDLSENGPERVEVYYFEQGAGEYLQTSEAGGASACERWAQGAARRAAAALVPLPAAARLLLAAPLALLITLERCALMVVRDLVTGVVQTASDYALKPALALVFNAVVRPPLVFAANVSRAVRAALRPLAAAATDAVEPAAALLRSLRLVTVRYDRAGGTRLRPDTDA
ncbi:unnamed protein product [Chilo suppressalis]|uniref:ABC transmembrane type-1 domain-containing protein n=1 Tax=Chilo suppressalis TaxID=168631 RepID=A0ABN8BAD9_CHISP|nr:unnamed protein product [Chilo suppressalis]